MCFQQSMLHETATCCTRHDTSRNAAVASLQHAADPLTMHRWRNWAALQTSAMFACLLKLRIHPTCCTSDCNEQDSRSMRLGKNACFDNALLSLQLHIHSSRCEADAGREEGQRQHSHEHSCRESTAHPGEGSRSGSWRRQ